jgi:WD40 repeat protein
MRDRNKSLPVIRQDSADAGALAVLNSMRVSGGSRMSHLKELLGASQLWWRCCVEAMRDNPDWLRQSYAALTQEIAEDDGDEQMAEVSALGPIDPSILYAVDLFADPALDTSRGIARPITLLKAARGTAAVALSLAISESSPAEQVRLIRQAVAYWRGVNVLPDVSAISTAIPRRSGGDPAGVRRVAQLLDELPDRGLAACATGVQALLMSGAQPSALHRQHIGVLLAADELDPPRAGATAEPGKRGVLTMSVLPGGPTGLFPDPRTMGFFDGDGEAFASALKAAWEYATRGGGAKCLLWSLTEPNSRQPESQEPYLLINGPSLGLAFALTIDNALRRISWPSLRMARTDYAVTGAVRGDGRLEKVGGIASKVEAVRGRKGFLVIAPAANKEQAERQRLPDAVDYRWPGTVREARRLTRRVSRVRIAVAVASACVIGLGVGGIAYRLTSTHAQQQLKASVTAQLDATASEVNTNNPTLGMQLALQANAQDPSDRTREDLLSQLAADGSLVRTLRGHTRAVIDASISTIDGTPFAVTGGFDEDLRVWDLTTGKCTDVVSDAEQGVIDAVAFDPVLPSRVFTAGINDATLWTVTPDGQLANPRPLIGSNASSGVFSAAFSPDGLDLALGYEDGTVRIVNPATGSVTSSLVPSAKTGQGQAPITSVTFGATDRIVYAGDANNSSGGNGSGNVYEIRKAGSTGKVTLLPTGQYGSIDSMSYVRRTLGSPVLLIGTTEGLEAWDPSTDRQAEPFPLAGVTAQVASIKSNAQISAVGTIKGVTIIQNADLSTSGQPIPGVNGIGLDDSSTYLLTSASDGDLYEWNLNDQPLTTGLSMVSDATAIAFSPDGSLLTVDSAGDLAQYPEELPGNEWQEPSSILAAHTAITQTLAVQLVGGQEIAVLGDWSENNSQVVLVNVKRKSIIHAPQLESFAQGCGGVRAAAFSPDGSRLVIGCFFGGRVSAWNTRTWRQIASVNLASENIETLAVTNDNTTVVVGTAPNPVGSDGSPQAVWFLHMSNLHTESSPVAAHPGGVLTIAQAGQRVFTGGWDGTIRSWTLDGRPTGQVASVNGHVYVLAYDPQSNVLVASTSNGLTLYDPGTLQSLSPPLSVGSPDNGPQVVVGLAVSPDGRYLAGTLSNQTGETGVAEWAVTEPGWIAQMCAKTAGNLTDAEWQQYGSPAIAPISVCPSTEPSGPNRALANSSVGPNPGLTPIAASAIPRHHDTCAGLVSSSVVKCGLFGNGYAWTIKPVRLGVRVTIYANNGSAWKPVLATSKAMQAYEANAMPFSAQGSEHALAVWQVNTGDGSGEDLSIVEGGHVVWDQEGNIEAIRPQRDGLRIWMGIYNSGDAACCPSGHVSELLVRSASGAWTTEGQEAVSTSTIPRMSSSS